METTAMTRRGLVQILTVVPLLARLAQPTAAAAQTGGASPVRVDTKHFGGRRSSSRARSRVI